MEVINLFAILQVAVIFLHAANATTNEDTIDSNIVDNSSSVFPGNNYTY